jgi:hypothetical protein
MRFFAACWAHVLCVTAGVEFRETHFLSAQLYRKSQSLQVQPVPPDALAAETVVSVRWADPKLRKMALDAAHLFNRYFNHQATPPRDVTVHAVPAFEGNASANKIGSVHQHATNETWIIQVKDNGPHSVFNTIVHEIAHVLVPTGARTYNAPARVIDESDHWLPYDPQEVFSPVISNDDPFLAAYTLVAILPTTLACEYDRPCADVSLQCVSSAQFTRVPRVCTAVSTVLPTEPVFVDEGRFSFVKHGVPIIAAAVGVVVPAAVQQYFADPQRKTLGRESFMLLQF